MPGELRWFCARQGALLDVLYRRDESGNVTIESLLASPEPNTFPFIPLSYRRTYGRCWLQEEDADFVRQKKRCQEFLNLLGQSQPHAIFANVLSMWPLA